MDVIKISETEILNNFRDETNVRRVNRTCYILLCCGDTCFFFFFRGRKKKREGERNGQFSIEGIEEGKLVRSRSFEDK